MRSKTDWPPEVVGVLDLLESQPPEAAMLVECFLAAVTHPDHVAELAMFDKLPSAARIVVGRFFSFFLAGGLDDAGQRKAAFAHAGMVRPSAPFPVNGLPHPLGPGKGWTAGDAGLRDGPAPPENLSHTTQLPLLR